MILQRNYFGSSRRRITAFLLLAGLISFLLVGLVSCQSGNASNHQSLAAARRAIVTQLRVRGPAPQSYQDETPPPKVQQVEYPSGNLQLKGWLSQNSGNGKKQPAIVYLHGGWSFGAGDWQDAAPFTQSGFVLFMPMLRAENGNPGVYESFLGEVDDAIAAGKFVASLPNVDPQNVFVVGHSIGGVLTTLVSMLPSPYKAAAAFDGYVDMASWAAGSPEKVVPYDRENREEVRIRNPLAFANSIQQPLRLYVGESRDVNQQLATKARKAGKDCQLITVPGDHQAMVAPAVQQSIAWFKTLTAK
jgi:dipeptidyl aminopeptidase/acylaminoacyl peptidase